MKEEFLDKPKVSAMNPRGLPERTVSEAAVREFGPVTFPAYEGATAGLRSMTDEFIFSSLIMKHFNIFSLIRTLVWMRLNSDNTNRFNLM